MPELILKLGDQTLQTYVCDSDVLSVGRSRDNDIVIENLSVSRNHARIAALGGKYILTDLNSANGTMVNGVRVTKTEIVHDDVISFGKHKLHFHEHTPGESRDGMPFDADHTVIVDPGGKALLCVTEGKLKGHEFPMLRFETSIGKATTNDISIADDWFVAKRQACIIKRGSNEFEIRDFGGLRKTKVNGQSVTEPVVLKNGDVIEIGAMRSIFKVNESPYAPTGRVPREIKSNDSIFEDVPSEPLADEESESDMPSVLAAALKSENVFSVDPSLDLPSNGSQGEIQPSGIQKNLNGKSTITMFAAPDHSSAAGKLAPKESFESPALNEAVGDSSKVFASAASVSQKSASPSESVPLAAQISDVAPFSVEESMMFKSTPNGRLSRRQRRRMDRKQAPTENGTSKSGKFPAAGNANDSTGAKSSSMKAGVSQEKDQKSSISAVSADEIHIWEEALKNPSPVIRKQAARTLKKLTGRDYEV